jgi:hypothetical protein
MIKCSMSVPIFTLPMLSQFGQTECGQQDPYSKAVKELPQLLDTAADGIARCAMI